MGLAIVVGPDGRQRRLSAVAAADVLPLETDERLLDRPAYAAEPDPLAFVWDPALEDYVARPTATVARTLLSRREFRNRLGQPMRLAILKLRASTDPTEEPFRLMLEDMAETLLSVTEVDLENKDTKAAVFGLAQLAQLGKLPPIDPAVVLAPSSVAQE